MEMKQLNDQCYVFISSVNVGYVLNGNQGMLIDAAIDRSAIRKVVRQLDEHQLPLTHLFITHAHADHYGGASYLVKHYDVKVLAPTFESAILANPVLEPTYLFSGNDPIDELRNKFLEGPPVEVDIEVDEGFHKIDGFEFETIATPGHSYHQMAIKVNHILYAADSYFGQTELEKHKIPYITSVDQTLVSLEKLKKVQVDGAIPGHGKFERNFIKTLDKNIEYHKKLLHKVYCIISDRQAISHEELVSCICNEMGVKSDTLSPFLLYRTATTAYVTALINQGKVNHYIQHFRWMFKINKEEGR
ncbi:MBL fold metallo-hydrolase [Piscibacillus sp. B03]|uniref:MBL fold metallo-hydrolase n=1 Tax=Piscibacillus sp. B03 TaxID=3457430 RepID=UPI003FCD0F0F